MRKTRYAGAGRRWWWAAVVGCVIAGPVQQASAAPTIAVRAARFGNVFVTGDPPVLSVTVTGDADEPFKGRLLVQTVDAYRARAGRASVAIDVDAGQSVSHEVAIQTKRLGYFNVVATVRDARGQTVAREETTAGIVPPIDQSDAEESAVGYFVNQNPSELPQAGQIAAQMRLFGIRWVRLTFNWWFDGHLTRPDMNDSSWLDSSMFEQWVDAFRANGIEVVGVFLGTPRWASPGLANPTSPDIGIPPFARVPPLDPVDWTTFVRTLAGRLRGRVGTWEVWNEPDIPLFWEGGAPEYASLLRSTAATLHEVDPGIRVLVNLVERNPVGLAFTDTVIADAGAVIDVFGFHYSTADARDYMPLLRPGTLNWNTEALGAPRRHVSRWLSDRAAGVERIFPYLYHDIRDDSGTPLALQFGSYPVNVDYTPRVDAIALTTLSRLVGTLPLVGAETVGLGYSAYAFNGPDGEIVALADGNDKGLTWSTGSAVRLWLSVPRDVRKVRVVDLMGNSRVVRVRRGALRLRLDGVAAFLLPEGGASLRGLGVVRARRAAPR
jgi:hypothetical protein